MKKALQFRIYLNGLLMAGKSQGLQVRRRGPKVLFEAPMVPLIHVWPVLQAVNPR